MLNLTVTADELFALCRDQVPPDRRDALEAEIARRWPDGLRLPVFLPSQPAD